MVEQLFHMTHAYAVELMTQMNEDTIPISPEIRGLFRPPMRMGEPIISKEHRELLRSFIGLPDPDDPATRDNTFGSVRTALFDQVSESITRLATVDGVLQEIYARTLIYRFTQLGIILMAPHLILGDPRDKKEMEGEDPDDAEAP